MFKRPFWKRQLDVEMESFPPFLISAIQLENNKPLCIKCPINVIWRSCLSSRLLGWSLLMMQRPPQLQGDSGCRERCQGDGIPWDWDPRPPIPWHSLSMMTFLWHVVYSGLTKPYTCLLLFNFLFLCCFVFFEHSLWFGSKTFLYGSC